MQRVFVPPKRRTVSEWAADEREINQVGAYTGPWLNETVPYIVEPADELTSDYYRGTIFAGPAQCAKTDGLIVNWVGQSVEDDGQDMAVVSPSFTASRDFSIRRIDRLIRHTPSVKKSLAKEKALDNKFDKTFQNGMLLTLSHPSKNELSGKPIGHIAITDYDRIDDDVDGEGSAYDLASKRTTTFGSYAMTLAESSPSREITDYRAVVSGHMAPPCGGILGLYNRGDRRRWHWPCPECNQYFEGEWELLKWDHDLLSNMDKADSVYMECPHCDHHIQPKQRHSMQQWGIWLKEGQTIDEDGYVQGRGLRSNIASFWLKGPAAALTTWENLVKTYLDAEDEYNSSGDEGALKKFYNTDIGVPYIPKNILNDNLRLPETLQGRCEHWTEKRVPLKVRLLVATVDVQKNMFVVQIHGIAPGEPFDIYLVDRFNIQYSDRLDPSAPDGKESYLWIKPGTYLEDWDKLIEQVILKTYLVDDDSGRKMQVKLTVCDSGGKAGVTTNAYDFYRSIKKKGLMGRFHLLKGESTPGAPRARITYPDADKKAKAGARGEIPLLMLNPNINKDNLDNRLDSLEPGKGMIHLPDWLIIRKMTWFFSELTSETRVPGKGWEKTLRRNEAWDLLYYCIGACVSSLLSIEKVNWLKPPAWADEWDNNPLVLAPEAEVAFEDKAIRKFDFAALGKKMG